MKRSTAVLLVSLLATACTARKDAPPAERTKLRVASASFLGSGVIHVGVYDSIFAAHGLDVEIVPLQLTEALPLLLTGKIDASVATLSPGIFAAMAGGEQVRIVAARNYFNPDRCTVMAIMAPRTRVARARGKTSIVIGRDLAAQYLTETSLGRAGVSLDTMETRNVHASAGFAALKSGTLDYALASEPWTTRALDEGNVRWLSVDSVMSGTQSGFVIYGPAMFKDKREVGQRFMNAYLEAVQRYSVGATPRNVAILSQVTGEKPELLQRACWPAMTLDGRVRVADLDSIQAWALRRHYIKAMATADQMWDSSFVAAAGPVRTP